MICAVQRPPRPLARTHWFPDFPRVSRPAHYQVPDDYRLGRFAWTVAELLAACFPPHAEPFTAAGARQDLCRWCVQVGGLIEESSGVEQIDWHLASATPGAVARMQAWLDGTWSPDRSGLEELLWRLGLPETTVSAALWLHQFAVYAEDDAP
jgi:hypothetical protein